MVMTIWEPFFSGFRVVMTRFRDQLGANLLNKEWIKWAATSSTTELY